MSTRFNAFLLTLILAFSVMIRDSKQTPMSRFGRGSLPRYGKRFVNTEQADDKLAYYSPGGNVLCEINTETYHVRCGSYNDFSLPEN